MTFHNEPLPLQKEQIEQPARESHEKGGMVEITFGDDCLIIDDIACKKLS